MKNLSKGQEKMGQQIGLFLNKSYFTEKLEEDDGWCDNVFYR